MSKKRKRTFKEKTDYLLACLSEECSEVQKVISKSQRFGLTSKNPENGSENIDLIQQEMHDVMSVWYLLCDHTGMNPVFNPKKLLMKTNKVEMYSDPKYYVDDTIGEEIHK